jgi:cytochrome bd ubiquinol oxidase subunit II
MFGAEPEALAYTLPVIWAIVLAVAVALYIVLDGFDLGIGILYPVFPEEKDRDHMMNSVAPFWDGNETWLVLGGGGLWVAFPQAYAIIMPALYLPVIVMLLALVFRGVAFEFRWVAKPDHRIWDRAFFGGSIVAAFCQGLILGGILQGIEVQNGRFAGGSLDWATPFSLLCGVGVVCGYVLLACGWLMIKTDGELAERASSLAQRALVAMLLFIGVVSVWTPLAFPHIAERWFTLPNFAWLSPVPVITLLLAWVAWRGVRRASGLQVFLATAGLFLVAYAGLLASTAPWIVPTSVTIWQAAASPASQAFLLLGTMFLLPLVLGYTVFVFWVFRGKVTAGAGYH